jgi:hypothetical protein
MNNAANIITQKLQTSHPNPDLIRILTTLLAKVRAGEITDAVIIGCSSDYREWLHHYSVAEHENMTTMLGELDLFKDVMKAQVHKTRSQAAAIKNTGSVMGG